ncbi:MAG: lysozyme [Frankiaceae bacterium]|nr:lysozyme [Frankiaceae bacterium]
MLSLLRNRNSVTDQPQVSSRRTRRGVALAVAGVSLGAVAAGCTPAPPSNLGTTGALSGAYAKNVFGIDVASYQHPNGAPINWASVRAGGAAFAFVKMSEGDSYTNVYAAKDLNGARAAGLRASAYHFARPRLPLSTATSDAQRFAAQVGNVKTAGSLPPVLDIEVNGGLNAADTTTWTRTFLNALEARTGRTPMIYTGGWFWKGYMGNPTGFSRYPIWISHYNSSITSPSLFGDWSYSTFWQYTDAARVSGISGGVDGNYFHGSRAVLDQFAYVGRGTTPPAPVPVPTPKPTPKPVPVPTTPTSTKPSASLTMTVAPSVPPGAALWIGGTLTDNRTKAPLAGKTFSVWRKSADETTYFKLGTNKTAANGTAFWATEQYQTSTYQFRLDAGAAGAGFPAVLSPARTVTS